MPKRLINFRGTKDYARVEVRKGGGGRGARVIKGSAIVWAACSQLTGVQMAYFKTLSGRALIKPPRGAGISGFKSRDAERALNSLSQDERNTRAFMGGDVTGAKGTTFFGQINKAFIKAESKAKASDLLGMVGADGGIYISNGVNWVQYSKPCKKKGSVKSTAPAPVSAWKNPTTQAFSVPDTAESDNKLFEKDESP